MAEMEGSKLGAGVPRHAPAPQVGPRAAHLGKGGASPSRCIPPEQGGFRAPRAPHYRGALPGPIPATLTNRAPVGCAATPCRAASTIREPCSPDTPSVWLPPDRLPQRRSGFRARHHEPKGCRPGTLTAASRGLAPPCAAGPACICPAMTDAPDPPSMETRAAAPDVIYLPDLRQRTKKVTSGSEKRQRSRAIRVRVFPADEQRLKIEAAAAGMSVAGYLASGRLGDEAPDPPRMNRRPYGRCRGPDAGPGRSQPRRQ